jgi:type IV secretory pathway VirB10-like protein
VGERVNEHRNAVHVRTAIVMTLMGVALTACVGRKAAGPPPAATPAEAAPASYPQQQPGAYPAAPPAPPPPGAADSVVPPAQPSTAPYASPPNRAVALSQASNDIEASQRELDVAGGDCRNACRALGSMDRAAGRICGLAQTNDEQRRCGDAKTRVYSARDKVRNTCGTCPDVSVDRDAPVPSR